MILYMRTLPSFNTKDDKKDGAKGESINADDPANRDKVLNILNGNG